MCRLRESNADFEVCLGSLSTRRRHPLFNFSCFILMVCCLLPEFIGFPLNHSSVDSLKRPNSIGCNTIPKHDGTQSDSCSIHEILCLFFSKQDFAHCSQWVHPLILYDSPAFPYIGQSYSNYNAYYFMLLDRYILLGTNRILVIICSNGYYYQDIYKYCFYVIFFSTLEHICFVSMSSFYTAKSWICWL